MTNENIEKAADELVEKLEALKKEVKDMKTLKDIVFILPDVIKLVESFASKFKVKGRSKKELAIAIVNKLVDIPYAPEAAERVLIGLAIDAAINALNKLFGKDWLSKLSS